MDDSETGRHELEVLDDAEAVACRAADLVAGAIRAAAASGRALTLAVSGGRTPWRMFALLAEGDVPWHAVSLWQVDERVAPDGDPDRNLTQLLEALPPAARPALHPMPVTDRDLDAAAERYAASLPARFDLVHLGLGDDGHTASLVPGDPVLEVTERDVAVTQEYRGRRRLTLTYPVLDRAREALWLVTGADKEDALRRLLARDPSIPAGRVRTPRSRVIADRAALGEGPGASSPPGGMG